MIAGEVKDNESVHIMHGGSLWERGTAISNVEIDGTEHVVVRVNGYADRAYEYAQFRRTSDNQLRVEL
jgi:hypothetical protein